MTEKDLLKNYGSPLYIYEENILQKRTQELLDFAEKLKSKIGINIKMHYSTKANANLHILKNLCKMGIAVDSMSPVELELTQMAGFKKEDTLYVCNNVSQEEIKMVVDKGILICLDSITQIKMLGETHPNTNIIIRINPEEDGVGHCEKVITSGKESRFGILQKDFEELFETTKKYNIKIIGVHLHLGSSFLNNDIDKYITGLNAGLEIIQKYFKDIEIVDFGGGFGVPYKDEKKLDLNLLADKIGTTLQDFIKTNKIKEIKFEPGRYIPCEAGYILGEVTSIKTTYNKTWIGTNIGMNTLIRPAMYDAYHKIEIMSNNTEYITATIAGNVCENSDILGKDRKILKPEIGDIVKVYNTGAYGYSMCSNYTGRTKPAEVLITKTGEVELIRKRETIQNIINEFNI